MKAYLDSSVVLRTIFGEPNALKSPKSLEFTVAADILKVECLRTVDRMRHALRLPDEVVSERSALLHEALKTIRFAKLTDQILERAGQPFPTPLGTLDALHLSTALTWQARQREELTFLTHDEQLGRAARAMGFTVLGCT